MRTRIAGHLASAALLSSFAILLCFPFSLWSQEKFRKTPPSPEPLQDLSLPAIESARLSNGLSLTVGHKADLPLMSLQLIILAGEADSPRKTPGLAAFAAQMIGRGTELLSSSDIEEELESFGGNYSAVTMLDYSVFTLNFLEEYLDQALSLLSRMVLQPAFPDREIEAVKRTMYYDLLEKEKDPEFVAKKHLFRLLFENHPYGFAAYNEDVIKNLNQKDLLAFFKKFYRPNNGLMILTGNLNLITATRKVSHYFNTWENQPLDRLYVEPPQANAQTRVCLLDHPQDKDAMIYLGNIIFPPSSPDYFPFLIFNQVLGGTTNSRLFMNLRESRGYAYLAFSETEFEKTCGIFYVKAKVTAEATPAAIQEILREIQAVSREKIATSELERAKSYLIQNFPVKNERLEDFSATIARIVTFNLGDEHWTKYYENIMLLNSDRVHDVLQRYPLLTPVIVIVGDKNQLIDYLREFEKVEVYNSKGILESTITKGVNE
jgi:zinc protease